MKSTNYPNLRPLHPLRPLPTPLNLWPPPPRIAWNSMFLDLMGPDLMVGSSRSTNSSITMPNLRMSDWRSPPSTWRGVPWPGFSGWLVMVSSLRGQYSFRRCKLGSPRYSTRIPLVPSPNSHSVQQSPHTFQSSKTLRTT